jgi:hypothetical protein
VGGIRLYFARTGGLCEHLWSKGSVVSNYCVINILRLGSSKVLAQVAVEDSPVLMLFGYCVGGGSMIERTSYVS